MRRFLSSAVLLCAVAGVASASSSYADLSGKWNLTIDMPTGPEPAIMIVTQKNDTLSGTFELMGERDPISGTVRGDSVFLMFTVTDDGRDGFVFRGSAAVKEGDAIEGRSRSTARSGRSAVLARSNRRVRRHPPPP